MNKQVVAGLAIGLVILLVTALTPVRESQATPAFARKYNADCAMCHYPHPPRLNSFGQKFRWAGYRTPSEFNKDQDVTKVGDFLSTRLATQFGYQSHNKELSRSEFILRDFSLYYAGAVSQNISAWTHTYISGTGTVSFDGQIQGVMGKSDRFFSLTGGQMHFLQQRGLGGLDRQAGITANPVSSTKLTNGGAPINFDTVQKGLEAAYVQGQGKLVAQVMNGVDKNGSGTANAVDIDPQKDYIVSYQHILDEIASGLMVFYNKGTTHLVANGPDLSQRVDFWRTGLYLNKVVPMGEVGYFELQGGYVRSHDSMPIQAGPDKDGNAYYIESQQFFMGPELTFIERFSFIDQDVGRPNSVRKLYTAGAVTRVQTWGRAAVEYTLTDNRGLEVNGTSGHTFLLEYILFW
ncbi:MAG: hypothetical protein NTX84_03565 [Nitrospirae bacterium]|nr:hypothetical protein [Nitrospirota bacterium]